VAKGLKVPCLFMITEVSIRCQKNPEVGIRRIPAYTPQYTTGDFLIILGPFAFERMELHDTCTRRPTLFRADLTTIDVPWRNFPSPEFVTVFLDRSTLVGLCHKIRCRIGIRKRPCHKPARSVQPFR